ncbi:hypothetical protein BGZ94_006353, partial [Podila epigama]
RKDLISTRFAIQNYFFDREDTNLEKVKTLADQIAKEFDMGRVIKIDIPRFRYGKKQATNLSSIPGAQTVQKTHGSRDPTTKSKAMPDQ